MPGTTTSAVYTCTNAAREYAARPGCGAQLPVETTGGQGTACVHWQESTLKRELMTSVGLSFLFLLSLFPSIGLWHLWKQHTPFGVGSLNKSKLARSNKLNPTAQNKPQPQPLKALTKRLAGVTPTGHRGIGRRSATVARHYRRHRRHLRVGLGLSVRELGPALRPACGWRRACANNTRRLQAQSMSNRRARALQPHPPHTQNPRPGSVDYTKADAWDCTSPAAAPASAGVEALSEPAPLDYWVEPVEPDLSLDGI